MISLLDKNDSFTLADFEDTLRKYPGSKMTDIARFIGQPVSTLYTRQQGRGSRSESHLRQQILTEGEETSLVTFLDHCANQRIPLVIKDVLQKAQSIVDSRQHGPKATVNRHWSERFRRRHEELFTRWSKSIDRARVAAEDRDEVQAWYTWLYQHIKERSILASNL